MSETMTPRPHRTQGRILRVRENGLLGPFVAGTVLSERYLVEKHHADVNHILSNDVVEQVHPDTPLTPIAGSDLTPLINPAHPVAGGVRQPVYLNADGSAARMEEVPVPHAPPPSGMGRIPMVDQTEEQRLQMVPNFPPAPGTQRPTEEVQREAEESRREAEAENVELTGERTDVNLQPASSPAGVGVTQGGPAPVDLGDGTEAPATGSAKVPDEEEEPAAAHRETNRGRGGHRRKS